LSARSLPADERHVQSVMGREREIIVQETTDAEKEIESGEFLKSRSGESSMSGGKRQNPQWLPEAFRESNTVFQRESS
jgi:hypothetical protein